jgi:hypothetical protein
MEYIRIAAVAFAILLLLSLTAWAISKYYFYRPSRISEPIRIQELDEVILRGEYFKSVAEELDKLLSEVGEVSQQLLWASEDWQERYGIFQSRMEKLSEDTKNLSGQRDQLSAEVSALQAVSPLAADYFVKMLNQEFQREGRRSFQRELKFFILGLVSSLVVSVVLSVAFKALGF